MLGHAQNDGPTYCFFDPVSTGIQAIQAWCRQIGNARRKASYPVVMGQLLALANTIRSYVGCVDMGDVAKDDAETMKLMWQSSSSTGSHVGIANRLQQVRKRLQTLRNMHLIHPHRCSNR